MVRIEKAVGALITLALAVSAQDLRFEVRHDHLRKGGAGTLTLTAQGIAFEEAVPHRHPHAWKWAFQDIQQLTIAPRRLTVLTYIDNRWRAGADRTYRFDLLAGEDFGKAWALLKGKLDQRLVAALPEPGGAALWRMPAKHLLRFGGEHGTLAARAEGLVFETDRRNQSRTWRWEDVENVSTSGPFQLTVTTFERARTHYGDLKGFNFQLKQRLETARYDDLWRRVHAAQGLPILKSYERTE